MERKSFVEYIILSIQRINNNVMNTKLIKAGSSEILNSLLFLYRFIHNCEKKLRCRFLVLWEELGYNKDEGKQGNMRRENISKKIQFIRSIKGISREELADATELSVSYLYQVESGKKNIGLSALIKVAVALNVSIDELVSGEKGIKTKDECQILLEDLISDCSEYEMRIIIEHARNFKHTLRKYIEGMS